MVPCLVTWLTSKRVARFVSDNRVSCCHYYTHPPSLSVAYYAMVLSVCLSVRSIQGHKPRTKTHKNLNLVAIFNLAHRRFQVERGQGITGGRGRDTGKRKRSTTGDVTHLSRCYRDDVDSRRRSSRREESTAAITRLSARTPTIDLISTSSVTTLDTHTYIHRPNVNCYNVSK